jgi:hypothetical protein
MLHIVPQFAAWLAIYYTLTCRVQAKTVPGGVGEAICTKDGNIAPWATEECCNGIDHNAYYSLFFGECWARGGPWHKALKYEEFARCCASRPDAGSSSSNRNSLLNLGAEPDPIDLHQSGNPKESAGANKPDEDDRLNDPDIQLAEKIKAEWMKRLQKLKDDRKQQGLTDGQKAVVEKLKLKLDGIKRDKQE